MKIKLTKTKINKFGDKIKKRILKENLYFMESVELIKILEIDNLEIIKKFVKVFMEGTKKEDSYWDWVQPPAELTENEKGKIIYSYLSDEDYNPKKREEETLIAHNKKDLTRKKEEDLNIEKSDLKAKK